MTACKTRPNQFRFVIPCPKFAINNSFTCVKASRTHIRHIIVGCFSHNFHITGIYRPFSKQICVGSFDYKENTISHQVFQYRHSVLHKGDKCPTKIHDYSSFPPCRHSVNCFDRDAMRIALGIERNVLRIPIN